MEVPQAILHINSGSEWPNKKLGFRVELENKEEPLLLSGRNATHYQLFFVWTMRKFKLALPTVVAWTKSTLLCTKCWNVSAVLQRDLCHSVQSGQAQLCKLQRSSCSRAGSLRQTAAQSGHFNCSHLQVACCEMFTICRFLAFIKLPPPGPNCTARPKYLRLA